MLHIIYAKLNVWFRRIMKMKNKHRYACRI